MTVRKTVLGVTSRKRDFAINFSLPAQYIVRMIRFLGTVQITANRAPSGIAAYRQVMAIKGLKAITTRSPLSADYPFAAAQDDRAASAVGHAVDSGQDHRRRRRTVSHLAALRQWAEIPWLVLPSPATMPRPECAGRGNEKALQTGR
jgi:hypothetical protein